ncbi:MAG TPA: serine/threonine-protein kinase [Myxococcota bacterium]|nr:serine/threonine-protein kinase [Myxococcota bacterium]HRY95724.1 serine/threonine-protein kinase [Myxococcota bacterium]
MLPAAADTLLALLALEQGLLSCQQLLEAVAGAEPEAAPLGERLERLGLLGAAQRQRLEFRVQQVLRGEATTLDPSAPAPVAAPADGPASVSDETGALIPQDREPRYRTVRVEGRGGQGRVLLALDERIGREVAVKELSQEGARRGTGGSSATAVGVTRFLREARVTGLLEHPNIIPVHELGRHADGTLYYTMRFVRGRTLAARLDEARGLKERLRLLGPFWDVCNALAFAHTRGVVHRDVKPENVMLGEFGETVVIDWGIARVAGRADPRAGELVREVEDLRALADTGDTQDGLAVGTPAAMSPEQATGEVEAIDERSDVWALGVMLYHILTGQKPFAGRSPRQTLELVVSAPLRPVRELCPEAPAELAAVAEKALCKDKAGRYQSAREVASEIEAYMTGGRVRAHDYSSWELLKRFAAKNRALLAAAGAVLAVILASLVLVGLAYRDESRARLAEHEQRLLADFHLAQAFAAQARRLTEERKFLAARILAAASLRDNPASGSAGFAARVPGSQRLAMEARSIVYQTDHRLVAGLEASVRLAEAVPDLAYAPDGRRLAAGDFTGEVRLLDPASGAELARFKAHADRIYALAFSPDGRLLATASRDKTVKLWEPGRAGPALTLQGEGELMSLAFSPDGRAVAVGEGGGGVRVWELPSGELRWARAVHANQVWGLAFSPDGTRLLSGSWDKLAYLLDAANGETRVELRGHTDAVLRVSYAPDGRRVATAAYDKTVRLWDAADGAFLDTLEGHRDAVYEAAWSADGLRLATASMDGTARLWDARSLTPLASLDASRDAVSSVAFSPDGLQLATAGYDRSVRLWRLRADDGLTRLAHPDWVYGVAFRADGGRAYTGCWDQRVREWELPSGRLVRTLAGHTDGVYSVELSPDGRVLASAGFDRTARLWDTPTGRELAVLSGHTDAIYQAAFSPDGKLLATAGKDRTLRLWSVPSGAPVAVLEGHQDWIYGVAFSPDGRLLASGSADSRAWLWSVAERRKVAELAGHSDWVGGVAFSPDGALLATSSKDGTAILWDVASRRELRRLVGHRQWVNRVVFSPDGRLLATASDDGRAMLWRVADGQPVLEIHASASVAKVAFSPDGRRLAVSDHDRLVLYPVPEERGQVAPEALLEEAEAAAGQRLEGFELQLVAP